MSNREFTLMLIEIKPADHLIASCIGKPGNRTFYIQAAKEDEILTILCEKFQVKQLAGGIRQFVERLLEKHPNLETSGLLDTLPDLALRRPIDPLFRVGEIGIGYDEESELMVLIAQELGQEVQEDDYQDDPETVKARIWATCSQMLQMADHGEKQVLSGRPICGNCMQPIDSEGHFCPNSNGHK